MPKISAYTSRISVHNTNVIAWRLQKTGGDYGKKFTTKQWYKLSKE